MKLSKSVEDYISKSGPWKEALIRLREIVRSTEMKEAVKWGSPVYTVDGKNIVGIGAFKSYLGIWFFQGALLQDKNNKLINAQEGITKALRQWRFSSEAEIKRDTKIITAYLAEAISNSKKGKEIKPDQTKPLIIPVELKNLFSKKPAIKKKFESFSLSHRREFVGYIAEAKRSETRQARLTKITKMIIEGVGLNDKYRK